MNARSYRFAAFILLITFAAPFPANSQSQHMDVTFALLPLPAGLRDGASILRATETGAFETLRQGRNGFFCLADSPGDNQFSVGCHPESLRAYLERRRTLSVAESKPVRDSLLTQAIRTGRLALPTGALSRFISGQLNPETGLPDSVWVWSEIDVPFANPEETGLPTENAGAAPWLMRAREHGAHIMIGYAPVAWSDLKKTTK